MKDVTTKMLGDAGEHYLISQFMFRGLPATKMPDGWKGYDIAVETGSGLVGVSVKTRMERGAWHTNRWFNFNVKAKAQWLACVFVPNNWFEPRAWIIPYDVAIASTTTSEKRKYPDDRDLSWKKLTTELATYEANWGMAPLGTASGSPANTAAKP